MNTLHIIPKRSLLKMFILLPVTLGGYLLYWYYKTRQDINSLGGKIPSFWWALIPGIHAYFIYQYVKFFQKIIHQNDLLAVNIVLILFMACFPMIFPFYIQYHLNKYSINK